ncbi:MAG: Trimethylamine corrinoid protein MtbC1 [Candidatus Methanohalarchaeum thermophilum]|uniref:Trimethylamine corrinoid protein MtbC1 n=1 Tax=Methanohalarchaeum thermophilum TaxID=1903181 RepID=A0A1Q6DVL8_METT1|nr:MAG: Trimethylamine corrinoid protein MtbC1 [Candidatus Methanohalarchaeum thermophilum]OKY78405.1 MAG: Trimethylamine corrinoid protein MtbC1 [Candidatus Methanohalarchaeum thermophilum]
MSYLDDIKDAISDFDEDRGRELAEEAVDEGVDPLDILDVVSEELGKLGEKFDAGEIFLPTVMSAADVVKAVMDVVNPVIEESGGERDSEGSVMIATVEGDIHDIGKSMVASMLLSNGYDVIDLGRDVPNEDFLKQIEEKMPDAVGMSSMLTTTMGRQEEIVEALREKGLKDKIKVIVGGAPITQSYADEIGADGYAKDAIEATKTLNKILNN